jgi:hypothetical protein
MDNVRFTEAVDFEYALGEIISNFAAFKAAKQMIDQGCLLRISHKLDLDDLRTIRTQLLSRISNVSERHTPRLKGCKDYASKHWDHPGQAVSAKYYSWSFFPWNDVAQFKKFIDLFTLRNLLANVERDDFVFRKNDEATARLAFQYYPCGDGFMAEHVDPYAEHQAAIPTLLLSDFGKDFVGGGFYVIDQRGDRFYVDHCSSFGDLTLFNPRIPHGVEVIQPEVNDALSDELIRGRFMMIAGVNGYAGAPKVFHSTGTSHAGA